MMTRVNATELEIIRKYEGLTLARHNGNLGIWSIHRKIDWDATLKLPALAPLVYTGGLEACLVDDDCNHLLDPEFRGVFEGRVLRLKRAGQYTPSLEA